MQTTPVFLFLGEIPAVRVDVVDAVADRTQRPVDFVIDEFHVVQRPQCLQRIRAGGGVMRESRQDSGVDSHRNRYGGGIVQPCGGALMVFGSSPLSVLDAARMIGIGFDRKMVALIAGERSFGETDHGDRIPFESLGLVDGHQLHIDVPP